MTKLSTGTYSYIVCYEWTDNNGRIQRSTTSEPQSITFAAGTENYTDVTIPTLRITSKVWDRDKVRICIYRTEANGTTYYRSTSVINPLFNNTTVDTITYRDELSDGYLVARERLYTDGNILDSDAPPASKCIATYRNRVWLGGMADDPQKLWYSQILIPGEPVCFSAYLTAATSTTGGKITALAVMDDALIIFKENAIFRLSGEGPDNTGNSGFYDDPQLITTDVGCTNPNSVATTPDGLVFQSAKGIMILDRSYAVQYIGAPVQQYNNLRISSTTAVPDQNIVIFTTANNVALVYDYYTSKVNGEYVWSTFTNHQAVDSTLWGTSYCLLKSNGTVYQQDQTKYTDGSTFVPLKLKTAYLNLAGLQGFKRIRTAAILGEFKGPHTLVVNVSYDFNENYTDTYTINATSVLGSNTWGGSTGSTWGSDDVWGGYYSPYQFILPALNRQKCQSIAFTITDSQSSNLNEGYSISAIALRVGTKQGLNKMPKTNKFG